MINSPHLVAFFVAATSSSKSSTSSSSGFLLLLIPLAVLGYFLLVRPQRQRARQQQAQRREFTVGDWVMTVGGLAGRVVEADGGEWIKVEVASGIRLDVLRQAVSRRLEGDPGAASVSSPTWGDRWADGGGREDPEDAATDGDRWAEEAGPGNGRATTEGDRRAEGAGQVAGHDEASPGGTGENRAE